MEQPTAGRMQANNYLLGLHHSGGTVKSRPHYRDLSDLVNFFSDTPLHPIPPPEHSET